MKSLICSILVICAVSCNKEDLKTAGNISTDKLYGKWKWVQSTGGFAGRTITPQSEGYRSSVEFKRNNTAAFYRNDSLTNQSAFTLNKDKTIFSEDPAYIIKYQNSG